jgi:hypothetical protein
MSATVKRYTLHQFEEIVFDGFDIALPEATMNSITELALQVGSPTYVRTPIFAKKEAKVSSSSSSSQIEFDGRRRRKGNKGMEVVNDEDWETIRTFQPTMIAQKDGIDAQVDRIRSALNKISDKHYDEKAGEIMSILSGLIEAGTSDEQMQLVGNAIFDIASNNRFYSRLYANLYTLLIHNFDVMRSIFDKSLLAFMDVFLTIETASPEQDYDKFCKVNKDNEQRKALSAFFVNLCATGIIPTGQIVEMAWDLLESVMTKIKEEGKKSEVDELIENIVLLYEKKWCDDSKRTLDDLAFSSVIELLARSKPKDYPSLSNKSIFKCMDMIEI